MVVGIVLVILLREFLLLVMMKFGLVYVLIGLIVRLRVIVITLVRLLGCRVMNFTWVKLLRLRVCMCIGPTWAALLIMKVLIGIMFMMRLVTLRVARMLSWLRLEIGLNMVMNEVR